MPEIEFLSGTVVLENAETRAFQSVAQRPSINRLLLIYTRHWFAKGWLPHPSKSNFFGTRATPQKGPLYGLRAIVIGASSGIGASTATALANAGCQLTLAARRIEALEELKRSIDSESNVTVKQCDVTKVQDVTELFKSARCELGGPIDIVINCAGIMYFTMMKNVQLQDWKKIVHVNCQCLLNVLAATVPEMLSRWKGHIVSISSDAGRKVFPGLAVYSESKFFVEATLQSLRVETTGTGLRVTFIQPGNVATQLLGMSTDAETLKKYGEPTGAKVLDPKDVAKAIIYALEQPAHVAVNEILVEPRDKPIWISGLRITFESRESLGQAIY
jgi:NADP-dependent 3-hydroxy acid dehydrogenase YdfG